MFPDSDTLLVTQLLALPASERTLALERACTEDPSLRDRLPAILATVDSQEQRSSPEDFKSLLGNDIVWVLQSALEAAPTEVSGARIGPYKLLQPIGQGGFGVVWMAEQIEPIRRQVALKIIKAGMDTKEVIARFDAERQALAMMDHVNIARVFDAGATSTGRPFFVMELVRGIAITRYCDENRLSPEARLRLFISVCRAVQHAHQKGVIHRDLKPSNILVTVQDGAPVAKVIDFGIAKATRAPLTDKTLFTQFHAFIGTPVYTSPEQMEMSGLEVDTRSDIYSLGVLLYELLTGRPPFDADALLKSGLEAMRRTIREVDPPCPSRSLSTLTAAERISVGQLRRIEIRKLSLQLRGDLDWIAMRCLEKDRSRRYETAEGVALDLERYLANEPVEARPSSAVYRTRKYIRRHFFGSSPPHRSNPLIGLLAALIACVIGLSIIFVFRPAPKQTPDFAKTRGPEQTPVALVPPQKSVAVLPFTNMSDSKDDAFFADGVQEDLLTNLANISELKVISRTSVMQYRNTTKSIHQIASELGVAYILEGSVRHAGGQIRVTSQLINAGTDANIWAKTYERDLVDIFTVQTDLSHEIASALQAALTPQESVRLQKPPTKSLAAYQLYQQAMAVINKGVLHISFEQALPLLEKAVEIDPNYAKAWAQIYWQQVTGYMHEDASPSRAAKMREAIAHAELADPNDFDVLFAAANLGNMFGDRLMADHYRQRIVELYPSRAEAFLALAESARDERQNDALAAYEKARALDPLNKQVLLPFESFLRDNRKYSRAEEIQRAIVQLDPGDNAAALELAALPFYWRGSTRELRALLARQPEDREIDDSALRTSRFKTMVELCDSEGMTRLWDKTKGNVVAIASNRKVRMLVAAAYLAEKNEEGARPLLQQSRDEAIAQLAEHPGVADTLNDLGLALAMLHDQKGGREKLAQARDIMKLVPFEQNVWGWYENALGGAWTGEKAEAIAIIKRILQSPSMSWMELNVHTLRVFQLTLPLRGDPAFEALLNDPANNAPLF